MQSAIELNLLLVWKPISMILTLIKGRKFGKCHGHIQDKVYVRSDNLISRVITCMINIPKKRVK